METWQFSLFFAALLVGYALMHVRVSRFEEHLQKLRSLQSIDDRLRQLIAGLGHGDQEGLQRIEALLQRLHEDLEDLREATAGVGEAVVQIPQPPAASVSPASAEALAGQLTGSAAERIRTIVESRLLQLGYGQLRLLTDLSDATLDHDVEVQVECERGHMPVKGRVLVRNGTVRDVAMQTVAASFP